GIHRQAMMGTGRGMVMWDEPATGGEAYIPKNGDPRRSLSIMAEAAGWYDLEVVPRGSFRGRTAAPSSYYSPGTIGSVSGSNYAPNLSFTIGTGADDAMVREIVRREVIPTLRAQYSEFAKVVQHKERTR